jgi:glycosyltransferase involved in cell wall biosynthesis
MYHGNVAAYALRSSYSSGCRLFWNVRQCLYDIRMEKPMTRTVIRVGARVSSAAHGIIYNSGISLAQHTQLGFSGDRALVIPNGFDTSRYRPDPERRASARLTLGIAPDEFVIGTVGRYHPVKDHKTLLSACAILVERGIKARFVIVGPGCGPDNAVLTDLASGLDLGSRVIRRDQWDDTSTLFQAFDAFCLTSVSEGFPNVLAEAMSCGVACVATNVGECALLLDRCGILVEASAPEEVARALTQLATMSEAQRSALGQSGRARICSDFKLSTAVRRYESLYASGCAAVT